MDIFDIFKTGHKIGPTQHRRKNTTSFVDKKQTSQEICVQIWIQLNPFPGIVCKGRLLPDGCTMTIALPLKELTDEITNNTILFAIGINDGERNKGRYRQIQWPESFEWIYKESYAKGKIQ